MNERYEGVPRFLFPPEPMAQDRGGNALGAALIYSAIVVAFSVGVVVGWYAWA